MNHRKVEYDAEKHEIWKAIEVEVRDAVRLTRPVWKDVRGEFHAAMDKVEMGFSTKYRGDVLICGGGKTVGLLRLDEVVDIGEGRYVWRFGDPRRVIDFDVRCHSGLFDAVFDRGDIYVYPRVMKMDDDDWAMVGDEIRAAYDIRELQERVERFKGRIRDGICKVKGWFVRGE